MPPAKVSSRPVQEGMFQPNIWVFIYALVLMGGAPGEGTLQPGSKFNRLGVPIRIEIGRGRYSLKVGRSKLLWFISPPPIPAL